MLCEASEFPIKGFIETSFIDWKGHLASVLFSGGCNFRCPYCHNRDLVLRHTEMEDIPLEHVILTLRKYRRWVDRVVVTGGEPTIHMNLLNVIWNIKKEGMLVKLDTNGSAPATIKGLVNEGLVDYLAMDIKGPIDRYKRWCGVDTNTKKIEESVQFVMEGKVDYEFRMTVVPFLHKEKDVYETAKYVKAAKRFYIQEFKPNNTLNPSLSDISLFSSEKMERIRQNVSEILNRGCRQNLHNELVEDRQDESP